MFDTLKYVRRLRGAGILEQQAEAHADALADAIGESVATRADVTAVRDEIKTMGTALRKDIAGLRGEMWKLIAAQTLVLIGSVAGIVAVMLRFAH